MTTDIGAWVDEAGRARDERWHARQQRKRALRSRLAQSRKYAKERAHRQRLERAAQPKEGRSA